METENPINHFAVFMIDDILKRELENSDPNEIFTKLKSIIRGSSVDLIADALELLMIAAGEHVNDSKYITKVEKIIRNLFISFNDQNNLVQLVNNVFIRNFQKNFEILKIFSPDLSLNFCFALTHGPFKEQSLKFINENRLLEIQKDSNDHPISQFQFEFAFSEKEKYSKFIGRRSDFACFYNFPYLEDFALPQLFLKVEENLKKEIPINEIISEMNEECISSKERMRIILGFYNNFDESKAAEVIYSIIKQNSRFEKFLSQMEKGQIKQFFQIYKEIFTERGLELDKIFVCFDNERFEKLERKSVVLLFHCISVFLNNKHFESSLLLSEWKNKKMQLSILKACTEAQLEGVDFRDMPKVKASNLAFDTLVSAKNNYCWYSQKFSEVLFTLAGSSRSDLTSIISLLKIYSTACLFLIVSFDRIPKTKEIIDISRDALIKILCPSPQKKLINELWDSSSKYMLHIFALILKNQNHQTSRIVDALSDHLEEAIKSDEYEFAIEICSFLVSSEKLPEAFSIFVDQFNEEKLFDVIDVFVEKITSNTSQLPNVSVNSFFASIKENSEKYSQTLKIFIYDSYCRCLAMRPAIKGISFQVEVPEEAKKKARSECSLIFESFIEGNQTADEMFKCINENRRKDPVLHKFLISRVFAEFPLISQRSDEAIESFFSLLLDMFSYPYISSDQTQSIYDFLFDIISTQQKKLIPFAISFLKKSTKIISNNPRFVYQIIKETSIVSQDTELHKELLLIASEMPEPLQATIVRTIPIHKKLMRFSNLKPPPPRVQDAIMRIRRDSSEIRQVALSLKPFFDWIAFELVKTIEEHPSLVQEVCSVILSLTEKEFRAVVVEAASYISVQHMLDPRFDAEDETGCFIRRGTFVLGRLIGKLTLGSKHCLKSQCLDLKRIILYGFSQGKLYGIIPFVTEIIGKADPFFLPPNPFTSGILYLLAAISQSDSLKMSIKNAIDSLMENMHIQISMFVALPSLFPEKVRNNNDYIIAPFSLLHFAQPNEVERILNFEEGAFIKFSMQYIVFPDSPVIRAKPELKDKLSPLIAQQAYDFIRTEGSTMSDVAASTAYELVGKDFSNSKDKQFMIKSAEDMVSQLASSLTLFTAPAKLSKQLLLCIAHDCDNDEEQEYLNSVTQKNYEWITQFLRDVVRITAQRKIRQKLEKPEEPRKSINIFQYGVMQTHHYLIYSDLINATPSQQPFPMIELQQARDNNIPQDPEFVKFLERFTKLIPVESVHTHAVDQNPGYYDSAISILMKFCPNLSHAQVDTDRFRSIMKTLLQQVTSFNHTIIDKSFCKILEKILPYVHSSVIKQTEPFFKLWVQTSIRSPFIICEFLKMKLITDDLLDKTFPQMLDSYPFNARNACFIIEVMHFGLVEEKILDPNHFIKTLACLSQITASNIDNQTTGILTQQQISTHLQMLNNLKKIYISMDSPVLQSNTSNQMKKYPPSVKYEEAISTIIELFESKKNPEKGVIKDAIEKCMNIGNSFLLTLFDNQEEKVIMFFMQCLKETDILANQISNLLEAAATFIIERIQPEMIHAMFNVILFVLDNNERTEENIMKYSAFLHVIRPTVAPIFTFAWIQLAASKTITSMLLKEAKDGSKQFSVLLTDFISIVKSIDYVNNKDVFDKVYIALLRYAMIVVHDFPEILTKIQINIVSIIPPQFRQLKNIFNSVKSPEGCRQTDIKTVLSERPKEFVDLHNSLFDKESNEINKENIKKIVAYIEDECSEQGIYIRCLLHAADDPEKEIEVINEAIYSCAVHTTVLIIEGIIDLLVSESDESKFGIKIFSLISNNTKKFDSSNVCPAELSIKLLLERCSAKGIIPWGLRKAAEETLKEDSTIYTFNFIKTNEAIIKHLKNTYQQIHSQQ